jgi:hypothetical protein
MPDEPELPEEFEGLEQQFMTIERLRDEALILFDLFIARQSAMPSPDVSRATAEEKREFLTLEETENIVREYAVIGPGMYAVGGDTQEEAFKQIRVVMGALMQRIMSNVLRIGADYGLVDVMFDSKTNDFRFDVSDKGQRVYERIKDKIEKGEDVDFDIRSDEGN